MYMKRFCIANVDMLKDNRLFLDPDVLIGKIYIGLGTGTFSEA